MSIDIIGKQIAALRKERGIKQDELAKAVGVSVQAVSKWENGGVPDIELIPKIADYFQVSADYLFGRTVSDYTAIRHLLMEDIGTTEQSKQMQKALDYCFDMEMAFFGIYDQEYKKESNNLKEYNKMLKKENDQMYSSVMYENGFTRMGLGCKSQYFLLVTDPQSTHEAYFEGMDYPNFFNDFSDRDLFNTCIFLNKRDKSKAFTSKLISKSLNIDTQKAEEILKKLMKYEMISKQQIEMDDEALTVYTFRPTPAFTALLIFAHEIIKRPRSFAFHYDCREKPYFQED